VLTFFTLSSMVSATTNPSGGSTTFGIFQLDNRTGELRKGGVRLRLQGQPLQVLSILLRAGGQVVTREELHSAIWPGQSFGDIDHALNKAIARLRDVLDDSAKAPRYIETLPSIGYRFIVESVIVSSPANRADTASANTDVPPANEFHISRSLWWSLAVLIIAAFTAAGVFRWMNPRHSIGEGSRAQRIAVLPFKNLSGDAAQDYFTDGTTDEIITELGKNSSLQVLSRTSVVAIQSSGKSLPEIANQLEVGHILEGAVLRSGERVRVTVQLIEARDDHHIWAQDYDRDLHEVLRLQADIARDVAEHVDAKIAIRNGESSGSSRQVDPEAHQLVLKGMQQCMQEATKSMQACVETLQQAVAKDPSYARAHGDLSVAYEWLVSAGLMSPQVGMPKAKAEALKAIELDPDMASGHFALGMVLADYEWDWPNAEREFRRAIAIRPSSGMAHHSLGFYLVTRGRFQEAAEQFQKCVDLDPLVGPHHAHLGMMLAKIGDLDAAERQFREALLLSPNSAEVHSAIGYSYLEQKRYNESIVEYERARALSQDEVEGYLGFAYLAAGRKQDGLNMLHRLQKLSASQYVDPYQLAILYAGLGDRQHALQCLENAYEKRSESMTGIATELAFAGFGSDARFQQLVQRMGLDSGGEGGI
jgi:TolB-like protein/DNA-binding winged helix-turn-helix (wHTH) protein/Flp pilus assembly protein TadD